MNEIQDVEVFDDGQEDDDFEWSPPVRLTEEQLQRALARVRAKHHCHGTCSRACADAYRDDDGAEWFDDHLWHQAWPQAAKDARKAGDHEGWLQALASAYRAKGLSTSPEPPKPKRTRTPRKPKATAAKGRAPVAKGVRFEVLKRDKFACVYCGAKAPDVLLHVDHINPVAKGGGNEILNLVTACEGCNLGKSDKRLDDGSAVGKARNQAAELQERREQIEMMAAWQSSLVDLETQQAEAAHEVIKKLMPGRQLSEASVAEMRRYLTTYGIEVVVSQFRDSFARLVRRSQDGTQDVASIGDAIQHALRALKWKKKNEEDPVRSQALYVRGILRNRLPYVDEQWALQLAIEALRAGFTFDQLKDAAMCSGSFKAWRETVQDMIGGA